jgi:integrase
MVLAFGLSAGSRQRKKRPRFHDQMKVAIRAGTHVSLPSDLTITDVADKSAVGRDGAFQAVAEMLDVSAKVLRSLKAMLKVVGCSHLGDGVQIEIRKRDRAKLEVGEDIPTPQEITRLVKAAKSKVKVLLMTAASIGLRASELRGLRWSDVDLKAGELHVRQRADAWNTIGMPKSDGSKRTIPLGSELVLALVRCFAGWNHRTQHGSANQYGQQRYRPWRTGKHFADRATLHHFADANQLGVGRRIAHPAAHVGVE